jgi:hypothetical protein
MARKESESYLRRLMRVLEGQTVGKKIYVLKEALLYWHTLSLFWNDAYEELLEAKEQKDGKRRRN